MLIAILVAMMVAAFAGVSLLVVSVVGALLMALVAFQVSRNPMCLRTAIGVLVVSAAPFLSETLAPELVATRGAQLVMYGVIGMSSLLCCTASLLIGLFGEPADAPNRMLSKAIRFPY